VTHCHHFVKFNLTPWAEVGSFATGAGGNGLFGPKSNAPHPKRAESDMNNRQNDALRRADLSLAGAILLGLSAATAIATYCTTPVFKTPARPKIVATLEQTVAQFDPPKSGALQPAVFTPEVVPVARPKPIFSRLKIQVALQNLAGETSCLAEALYYEARGQGRLGQQAIAEVVVRRTHKAGFPHSICGVVHQGSGTACQFSFACDGTMDRPRAAGEWSVAMHLAAQIITGALPLTDITQGAISFHAARLDADWPGMVHTTTVGHNAFYRRLGRPTGS
jgi:hypothetical protein